jgi:hypothetical protein
MFAYEVVHQHNRRIWIRELSTGATRLLTPGPGERYDLTWSPDNRRIAFALNDSTLRLVDVTSGDDSEVFRQGRTYKFGFPFLDTITWDSDSVLSFRIVDYAAGQLATRSYWTLRLNGSYAPTASTARDSGVASPDKRWTARSRLCCGGSGWGIWLTTRRDSVGRCLAGPVEYGARFGWSAGSTLIVGATRRRDDPGFAYVIDASAGPARRIADIAPNAWSVTISRDGSLAIVSLAPGDSVGELTLLAPPFQTVPGDTLPGCPDPPEGVMRFIAGERLDGYRSTEVLVDLPQRQFTIFRAVYHHPGDDAFESQVGFRYGDRIGWLPEPFRPRARDHALWSETFDRELRSAAGPKGGWVVASVHAWLATQSGVVPDSAIMRWLRSPPDERAIIGSALAARAPALRRIRSRDVLLSIADIGPAFAVAVIDSSAVRDDPTTLVDILRRPAFRHDASVQEAGRLRLIALAPQLAADTATSEPVLFELVVGSFGRWRAGDSVARLVIGHPAVRSSVRTLAVLAVEGAKTNVLAQARLAALGVSMDSALVELVREAAADTLPPLDLPSLFMYFEAHVRSAPARLAMARLRRPRYENARLAARDWLATQPDTPDPVLLWLARTWRPRVEPYLATRLLLNPHARANRDILATIVAVRGRAVLDSLPQ